MMVAQKALVSRRNHGPDYESLKTGLFSITIW